MPSVFSVRILRLKRAIGICWRGSRGWTVAGFGLIFVQGILPLASIYLMKLIVDEVTAGLAAADKTSVFGRVAVLVGLLAGAALLTVIFNHVAGLVRDAQTQAVTDYVHGLIHAQSIRVDFSYYEDARYHDTLHRVQLEAPYRPGSIVANLFKIGQSVISLASVGALIVSFRWAVAVALLIAAVPGILVKIRFSHRFYDWQKQRTARERLAIYFHRLLTGHEYAAEVRIFDLGRAFISRYRDQRRGLRQERLTFNLRRSLAELGAQSISILAVLGSLAYTARQAVLGAITLGGMVMYAQAFQRGQGFLQDFMGGMAGLYDDSLFLGYLDDFFGLKPNIIDPVDPRPVPRLMQKGIVLENVVFRYPGSSQASLDGVSLVLEAGKVTALVGHNGSGKTTLAKLLCRLYDPSSGRILLDGTDYREFRPDDLRREFGIALQNGARFYLSLRENIALSDLSRAADEGRLEAAAKSSGADGLIGRLPAGYATFLGKIFEKGEELSAGEWQKIALARAFFRDASIIILDEPTNALDAEAEAEVFQRFRDLAAGRTALIISHRFSTVRSADIIHVLEAGRVVESGTHDRLMAEGGTYARLFNLQARNYS